MFRRLNEYLEQKRLVFILKKSEKEDLKILQDKLHLDSDRLMLLRLKSTLEYFLIRHTQLIKKEEEKLFGEIITCARNIIAVICGG